VLLKEINHRVKNNLQIVRDCSISRLHAEEGAGRDALEDSQARVYAMALVHEELYRTGDFETVTSRPTRAG
jgi:two-component sensor histidine kinase